MPLMNPNAISHAGFHSDENGSFEVFWHGGQGPDDEPPGPPGWFWWSCSPGCLPDGEAEGPFVTSFAAHQAASDLDFSSNHAVIE